MDVKAQKNSNVELVKPHIYSIKQDSQLSYFYRVRVRDSEGSFITKKITCDNEAKPFQTVESAENHRLEFISAVKKNPIINSKPLRIQDIFEDYITRRGSSLRSNSIEKYECDFYNHILPMLGNRDITDISKADLNNLLTTMMFQEGYKYKTVINVLIVMRNIWRYSAELGIISSSYFMDFFCDPVVCVKMPIKKSCIPNKEIDIYTIEEQIELQNYIKNDSLLSILVYFGLHCGLRISEILGLKWKNINFQQKTLLVEEQFTYDKRHHANVITLPKTRTSIRKVLLTPVLIKLLDEENKFQKSNEFVNGVYYYWNDIKKEYDDSTQFICRRHSTGRTMTRSGVDHYRATIQKELSCNWHTRFYWHALRHTFASTMAGKGVPIKTLSQYLGHSDTQTTERYYLTSEEIGTKYLEKAIFTL